MLAYPVESSIETKCNSGFLTVNLPSFTVPSSIPRHTLNSELTVLP